MSFGLTINITKTETMILNFKQNVDYPSSIVILKKKELKIVQEFKYLGSYLNYNEPNTGDTEVNHRIQLARLKFAEMSNVLQNFSINLSTRISFLNRFIRSRITYSCQNWNLTTDQYNRLDICYRNLLRRMVRGVVFSLLMKVMEIIG